MDKIRIFFGYKHTNKPWGGANNFIRALCDKLAKEPCFNIHYDVGSGSDILFFSQLSRGPGNVASGREKTYRFSDIKKLKKKTGTKLVVRAVNLNINSNKPNVFGLPAYVKNGFLADVNIIRLLNFADFVIFQSDFQKSFFRKWGYIGKKNVVIHNGAPSIFDNDDFSIREVHAPLRLVSNSNYKAFKRHELVAEMSLLDGVDIIHVGNWSRNIDKKRVNTKGTLTHEEIIDIYKNSDYLLHPAVADPCPNSVIEALRFGLPVIYSDRKGSSAEIIRGNGIAIDENNLKKTIRLAKDNFLPLKQKLADERDYYSIERAVSMYAKVFEEIGKQ